CGAAWKQSDFKTTTHSQRDQRTLNDTNQPPNSSLLSPESTLNLAHWVPLTQAEGPGKRFALWVQGCAIRCPGCCNPEMFAFVERNRCTISEVEQMILQAKHQHGIEGISCLGGEPFSQAEGLSMLAQRLQKHNLSVMLFSGHTLEELQQRHDPFTDALLQSTDILIDGPYISEQHTDKRRWIGSENQRVHFLSKRYQDDDPCWQQDNTVELFFDGQELKVTGFPGKAWQEKIQKWKKQLQK
ncbi:MAG: 4Fe-4S single cluster domain-containing protein, partial [Myxococcota bacterium]